MNGYDLSRQWFDFSFENSRRVRPLHTAIYFWCIEKANRLGWPVEFQLPTDEACQALGLKDPKSFRDALNELVEFGAVRMVQQAQSQNVARYISLQGCQIGESGSLDRALSNENRLSEKRSSDTPSEPLSDTPSTTPANPSTNPLNIKPQTTNHKQGKEGSTEKPKAVKPPAAELTFPPFAGEAFRQAWTMLLTSKNWKGKPDTALQLSLNKLAKYDETFAVELMQSALENNWKGVVYDNTAERWQQHLADLSKVKPLHPPQTGSSPTYEDLLKPEFKQPPSHEPRFRIMS